MLTLNANVGIKATNSGNTQQRNLKQAQYLRPNQSKNMFYSQHSSYTSGLKSAPPLSKSGGASSYLKPPAASRFSLKSRCFLSGSASGSNPFRTLTTPTKPLFRHFQVMAHSNPVVFQSIFVQNQPLLKPDLSKPMTSHFEQNTPVHYPDFLHNMLNLEYYINSEQFRKSVEGYQSEKQNNFQDLREVLECFSISNVEDIVKQYDQAQMLSLAAEKMREMLWDQGQREQFKEVLQSFGQDAEVISIIESVNKGQKRGINYDGIKIDLNSKIASFESKYRQKVFSQFLMWLFLRYDAKIAKELQLEFKLEQFDQGSENSELPPLVDLREEIFQLETDMEQRVKSFKNEKRDVLIQQQEKLAKQISEIKNELKNVEKLKLQLSEQQIIEFQKCAENETLEYKPMPDIIIPEKALNKQIMKNKVFLDKLEKEIQKLWIFQLVAQENEFQEKNAFIDRIFQEAFLHFNNKFFSKTTSPDFKDEDNNIEIIYTQIQNKSTQHLDDYLESVKLSQSDTFKIAQIFETNELLRLANHSPTSENKIEQIQINLLKMINSKNTKNLMILNLLGQLENHKQKHNNFLSHYPDFTFALDHRKFRKVTPEILSVLTVSQLAYLEDMHQYIENLEALDLSNRQKYQIRKLIKEQGLNVPFDLKDQQKIVGIEVRQVLCEDRMKLKELLQSFVGRDLSQYQQTLREMLQKDLHYDQVQNLTLLPREIEQMPEYEKQIYIELTLIQRFQDIQQKINLKTGVAKIVDPFERLSKNVEDYKELKNHFMKKSDNFQEFVKGLQISKTDKNVLISLHNTAMEDEFYGERLYQKLIELVPDDADHLYILSLEWPFDIQISELF